MKRIWAAAALTLFILQLSLTADEGMWTFDNPPRKQWKERYNFAPSDQWLENVRLASVRLNDGGSGAFVSPNGLLMTNQHVASGQLQKVSTPERDHTLEGFYARSREEELKCPDLEINVLVSFENVTKQVQGAVKPGAPDKEANEQRKAMMATIEKESTDKTGLRSEVVKLYSGSEYWLYRYKKYTDIRLVFAAEEQIAFFGGDPDNFTYPRYDLDVAFFRVYENNQPLKTEHYFKWSAAGPADGEFVILSAILGRRAVCSRSRNSNISVTSETRFRCRSGLPGVTRSPRTPKRVPRRHGAREKFGEAWRIPSSGLWASRKGFKTSE